MEDREKRTKLMETGEVKRTLIFLGIPSIVAMIISAVYNFVDTMFVGMLNNTADMAAVSVAFPLFLIITALGSLIGMGASSYASRTLGQKRKNMADRTATLALKLAIIFAIFVVIIGFLFLKPILKMMGATAVVIPPAMAYSKWLVIGSITTILNMTMNNLIRAEGNAKYSMVALIIGAVLNIVLDPIFMFVFKWGVAGAAIATVVGQAVSTIYLLSYFFKGKSYINIKLKGLKTIEKEDKEIYGEIFKIGIPVFLMQFLSSIAFALLNSAASPYGDAAVASLGVTNRIYMIPSYIVIGFIQGFQPFAAYNYGAENYDRVKSAIKFSLVVLTTLCVVFLLAFQLKPEFFIEMLSKEPDIIYIGIDNLKAQTFLIPMLGIINLFTGLFQAMGKAKEAMVLSVGRQGVFLIPAILILPKLFIAKPEALSFFINILPNNLIDKVGNAGIYGVMYAQPFADLVTILLTLILGIRIIKQLNNEQKTKEEKLLKAS